MLAAQLGTCARLREQITCVLWGSSPRRFIFEVVCPLVGLIWKTNMEIYVMKALYLFPATAVVIIHR